MANKVNVTLDMNVQGYVQGIDKATESTEKYESETRKVADSTISFRKEIAKAKKSAFDLAASYAQLDSAAKNAAFGKEMARQLNEASEKAAEYINLQGDIRDGLNTLASETASLDLLTTGIGALGGVASTAAGAVALFTGNEKDAQKAVVMFTTVQSALNTVTSTYNAIKKIQNVLLVKGITDTNLSTAATDAQAAATGRATIAQRAFNAVAKANPYVLLASAVITVTAAIGAFILATSKSETELDKQKAELIEAKKQWDEYKSKVAESSASQIADFISLQKEWEQLKTTEEKNQFLDENKNKFKEMGFSIDDVNELEALFVKNSAAVISALKARAEAEAWGEIYKERLKKKLEKDANGSVSNNRYVRKVKAGDNISDDEAKRNNINLWKSNGNGGVYKRTITEQEAAIVTASRLKKAQEELGKENAKLAKLEKQWTDAIKDQTKAYGQLDKALTTSNKSKKKGGGSNTKQELTELEKLEKKVKDLEKIRANIKIDAPDADKLIKETDDAIKKAKDTVTKYKIAVGIEVEPSKLDKLETELKEKQLLLRADISQEEKDKVYEEILELIDRIQKEKIAAHIIIDPNAVNPGEALAAAWEVNKIVQDALSTNKSKPEYDFSSLSEEAQNQAEKALEQFNRIDEARKTLEERYKSAKSDEEKTSIEAGLQALDAEYEKLNEIINMRQRENDLIEEKNKKLEKEAQKAKKVGDYVQQVAEAFRTAGEATGSIELQVMGIVAQAIATVALSFANALNSCHTWYEWLAFGISGLATMVSMISQINSVTSGGYAQGGIIPGNSYSGDRLLANVNSGEMILNQRQQKNLFNMIDEGRFPQNGGTNVTVTGVIRGTDLLLVQKNTNKVRSRAGASISF